VVEGSVQGLKFKLLLLLLLVFPATECQFSSPSGRAHLPSPKQSIIFFLNFKKRNVGDREGFTVYIHTMIWKLKRELR